MAFDLYKNEHGKLLYVRSFCAYIDILGFSKKINQEDLDFFDNYLEVLNNELNYIKDLQTPPGGEYDEIHNMFELKIFTDNFVFAHPWPTRSIPGKSTHSKISTDHIVSEFDGDSELGNLFEVLSHFQFSFAKENIFLRGAICLSELTMDEIIVMGPALVKAYELESTKAKYPRIILSQEVVEEVKKYLGFYSSKNISPEYSEYLIDIDGEYFINYLFILFSNDSHTEEQIIKELLAHKNVIQANLSVFSKDYKLYDKFVWTARYHNYFCDQFLTTPYLKSKSNTVVIPENYVHKTIQRII